jgi:hypothetical protein
MWYPWTDDPGGLEGWTTAGIPGLPHDYYDDSEGFHYGRWHRGEAFDCCEGSFFQTDDGIVHMMIRTSEDVLAVSESRDDGESWSDPALTEYTDCRCRGHFGRLPDGRFFGLSCPNPDRGRTPMVLATSEDGVVFDRHFVLGGEPNVPPRMPGFHKSGRYGYPVLCASADRGFVIHSITKEDIAVGRFSLADIS